jgi:hypothetical protein
MSSVDDSKIYKIWACFEGKENIKITDDKLYKEATLWNPVKTNEIWIHKVQCTILCVTILKV